MKRINIIVCADQTDANYQAQAASTQSGFVRSEIVKTDSLARPTDSYISAKHDITATSNHGTAWVVLVELNLS